MRNGSKKREPRSQKRRKQADPRVLEHNAAKGRKPKCFGKNRRNRQLRERESEAEQLA